MPPSKNKDTCLNCDKLYNRKEVQKCLHLDPHEEEWCIRCISENLPLETPIDFNDTKCVECGLMFDSDKIKRIGIDYANDKCYNCLSNGMEDINCEKNSQSLCKYKNCKRCFDKSIVSFNKINFIHNKSNINLRSIFKNSTLRLLINCNNGHIWPISIASLYKNTWCPYCAKVAKITLKKYKAVAEFKSGEYFLDHIPKNTRLSIEGWKCKEGHIWKTSYDNVSGGSWCHYCAGNIRITLEGYKKLAVSKEGEYFLDHIAQTADIPIEGWKCKEGHIWKASYVHIKASSWCPDCSGKSKVIIEKYKEVAKLKGGEYFINHIPESVRTPIEGWKCEKGHIWKTCYNTINQGKWCPYCKNKTIAKLYEYLISLFVVISEFRTDWCKNEKFLPFDFMIEEYKLIIELDGNQHFKDIKYWNSIASEQIQRDLYKSECAIKNNYIILRLYQPDVLNDKIDWKNKILVTIKEIKLDPTPRCIFFAKDMSIYDKHDVIFLDDVEDK